MIKFILSLFIVAFPFVLTAQNEEKEEEPKDGWNTEGKISLLFSQAAFNEEWTGGGTNNIAANLALTYDFNYKKEKFSWDNKISAEYGITKLKDQKYSRKTNDRIELNSILGRQIKESNWFYSYLLNFKTQFTSGFEFTEPEIEEEMRTEVTRFMSPGYIQTGPGILWRKNDDLKVNIAPATARFILVASEFTNAAAMGLTPEEFNMEGGYFGVDANKTLRFELGASLNGFAKFEVMPNVTVENILSLYSNYLEDPQNIDIDYTLNLILSVNKWITAGVVFQAIYDDNAVKGFQIREALGIGLTYELK